MTKKETKGRSVVSSIIVLMLCFAMLLGTTYAWFTDSKSTAINKVKSGTLKVDIVDAYNTSLVDHTLGFVAADGRAQDDILWEPGCTYKVQDFYILNTGKLALKYKVYVNGIDGDSKLLDVIDWTNKQGDVLLTEYVGYLKPGERSAEPISIIGHMQETAGNEYQDLECEGIGVTVVATQWTYEKDSNSNQYDIDAEYPVASVSEFKDVVENIASGETVSVNLTDTLDLTKSAVKVNGESREGYGVDVPTGSTLIINGASADGNPTKIIVDHTAVNNSDGMNEGIEGATKVIFNNVTFVAKNAGSGYAVCTGFNFEGTVEFHDCKFENLYTAIYMNDHVAANKATLIIDNCTYVGDTWGYSIFRSGDKTIADVCNLTFNCAGKTERVSEFT